MAATINIFRKENIRWLRSSKMIIDMNGNLSEQFSYIPVTLGSLKINSCNTLLNSTQKCMNHAPRYFFVALCI